MPKKRLNHHPIPYIRIDNTVVLYLLSLGVPWKARCGWSYTGHCKPCKELHDIFKTVTPKHVSGYGFTLLQMSTGHVIISLAISVIFWRSCLRKEAFWIANIFKLYHDTGDFSHQSPNNFFIAVLLSSPRSIAPWLDIGMNPRTEIDILNQLLTFLSILVRH